MAITKRKSRKYARQRLKNPSAGEQLLIDIMGARWFSSRGWVREYEIPTATSRIFLDFGHPKYKINIEVDGDAYHQDVIKDSERDAMMRRKGWYVKRFRYYELDKYPDRVRKTVEDIYEAYLPMPKEQKDAVLKQWLKSLLP